MVKLVFLNGPLAGQQVPLSEETVRLGRVPDNQVMVADPSVSASHCEFLVHGTEVIVRELGSGNGTFVQGRRVEGQYPVSSGQVMRFGTVEARLEIELPESTDGATSVTAANAIRRAARR